MGQPGSEVGGLGALAIILLSHYKLVVWFSGHPPFRPKAEGLFRGSYPGQTWIQEEDTTWEEAQNSKSSLTHLFLFWLQKKQV